LKWQKRIADEHMQAIWAAMNTEFYEVDAEK
jgi:hypothetical protein